MNNIFFTSDTHWNHKNICIGVSEWDDKTKSCRNFKTLEEMNETIVKNINDTVGELDILYHLGDFSFGGIESIWEFRKQIKCKEIHLVLGNHDNHIKKNKQLPNCTFKELYEFFQPWDYTDHLNLQNAHDLFSSVQSQLELTIDKQKVFLNHFPWEEWELGDQGSIHLHGHCHGTRNYTDLNMYYRRKDVGLDWKEFRPYSWDEVKSEMKERKIYKRYE
jgi:calcineurin-like phosphoesterase family protein